MEQHPIPRNITGFQFKLIGDMTLKQFGYLAGGSIIGYALFKLLPLPSFITIILGGLSFFTGIAFAFLPFQDRPLDQWLFAFIKSVYAPTQFIYRKDNQPPDILLQTSSRPKMVPISQQKQFADSKKMLDAYLSRFPKNSPIDSFDQNERIYISQTLALFAHTTVPKTQPPTPPQQKPIPPAPVVPVILEAKKERPLPPPVHATSSNKPEEKQKQIISDTNQARQLAVELEKLRREMQQKATSKASDPMLEKRFLELEQKLTGLLTEREKLTAELAEFRKKESLIGKAVQPQAIQETPQTSNVKIISQQQATNAGILSPATVPNLVMGIVNDQDHNSLSNILITIKDMRGTPLRALKTNRLGQFFASTSLSNGTYVMEVEDPQKRFAFDLVELKLTGQIFQPLAIIAKQQVDPVREKLSKELFQKNFG